MIILLIVLTILSKVTDDQNFRNSRSKHLVALAKLQLAIIPFAS